MSRPTCKNGHPLAWFNIEFGQCENVARAAGGAKIEVVDS